MRERICGPLVVVVVAILVGASCGGGSTPPASSNTGSSSPSSNPSNVSLDKNSYPVFPNADAGADPAVPAEQGGKGFTGRGMGDQHGLRPDWRPAGGQGRRVPAVACSTFRALFGSYGPESNSRLQLHVIQSRWCTRRCSTSIPTTLEYMPALATHWQISRRQDELPLSDQSECALVRRPAGRC